jgi:hypothetical protein
MDTELRELLQELETKHGRVIDPSRIIPKANGAGYTLVLDEEELALRDLIDLYASELGIEYQVKVRTAQ